MFLFRELRDQPSAALQLPPHTNQSSYRELQVSPESNQKTGQFHQFAYVDEPFLSWDFSLISSSSRLLGSVNRNFAGFGREIFTDTGVYALRMDAAGLSEEPGHLISKTSTTELDSSGMSLDQRAVMLATAVSIDFDYFSRQRNGMFGGILPFWMVGGASEGAAAGAGAEAAGAATSGAGTAVGGVARGSGIAGAGEGAMAGAGTMAGYEAMQHGVYGRGDDASPTADNPPHEAYDSQQQKSPPQSGEQGIGEEDLGQQTPWDQGFKGGEGGSPGGGGEGEGENVGSWLEDFFN